MSKNLQYFLLTITFISLSIASYTLGQDTAIKDNPTLYQIYQYQTTSFDPIGDKNESVLAQNNDQQLINTTIKPDYLPSSDEVISRQNRREVCAFKKRSNNRQWVNFVNLINKKCNYANIDNCWQEQAISSNYNPEDIIECFSNPQP